MDNKLTTSNNSGTNWVNAHTNFASIRFNSFSSPKIAAGDTIWISGGMAGGTNTYLESLVDVGNSTVDGTLVNPITVRVGQDATNSGVVRIVGGISFSRKYWIIDGSKSAWVPNSVLDTYHVPTNCNIEVYQTNATMAVQMFGTGSKCKWVHVSEMSSLNDSAILWSDSTPVGDGAEIAYNWISHADGFGIRGEINTAIANTYGQLSVHHNLLEHVANNFFQFSGWVDVYKNVARDEEIIVDGMSTYVGHPDVIQEIDHFARVWDNIFYNYRGSRCYIEANSVLTHDVLVYNNIWYSTTNWYGTTMTNRGEGTTVADNPGTGLDITGHDNEVGQACNISNFWFFGNTLVMRGTAAISPSAAIWQRGSVAGRPSGWVTNFNFFNNNIIGVAPYNATITVQFFTNQVAENSLVGFDYDTNNVAVDFNSLNGFIGTANGVVWGPKGNAFPQTPYTNMAEFSALTQYKSNNNSAAVMVSQSLYDYRPQVGDAALVGKGTNLATALSAIAPDITNDIYGVSRGSSWTIGAFQIPSGYWVATNGNDLSAGTFATPWRTIQHAANVMTNGDTANVTPGDYGEYVVTVANGTAANRITFRAYPANDPNNQVVTKQFRVKHQYTTVEGFNFSKAVGANSANIRIENPSGAANGSDCIVTNNTFRDMPMIRTFSASFGSNFMHIRDAVDGTDFNTAGFVAGTTVWSGSDSIYPYTNCGPGLTISNISSDGLTAYFNQALVADSGTNYFAVITPGGSGNGWSGIVCTTPGGGEFGCSNIVIANNIFSNMMMALDIGRGSSNHIFGNDLNHLHAQYAMRIYSSNTKVDHNFIHDSPNILFWTTKELSDPTIHPSGSKFYDYLTQLTTSGAQDQTNVEFSYNWIQNVDNQMFECDARTTASTFWKHHNVYVGVLGQGGVSQNNFTMDHNTYLRISFDQDALSVIGLGGKNSIETDFQIAETNLTVTSNVFVNFGGHANLSQEAPYSAVSVTNGIYMTNYSVWSETMGWSNTTAANVGGTFGAGDPLFVNIINPLGPDGLPFTDDDGLRPLPNSTLALYSLGALQPLPGNIPIAHFRLILPAPGWKDKTGTNFDTVWLGLKPHERTGNMRPWATPEAIGTNGQTSATATLDASQSWAVGGTITNWHWVIQLDNFTLDTNSPYLPYTFTKGPTNTIALTITANGLSSTASNQFRLPSGSSGIDPAITVQPQNQTVTSPSAATFSVTATGTAPVTYQWSKGGVPIGGATQSSYTTPPTTPADNGATFYVVVTSANGSLQSSTATLTVQSGAPVSSPTTLQIGPATIRISGAVRIGP